MVKMQVRHEHIGDIVAVKSMLGEGFIEGMIAPKGIITKEFFRLFGAHSGIDEREAVSVFNEHASGGDIDEVIGIGGIGFAPNSFGNNAKHGTAVEFEVAGFNRINFHRE
jgi:hypothetical protein